MILRHLISIDSNHDELFWINVRRIDYLITIKVWERFFSCDWVDRHSIYDMLRNRLLSESCSINRYIVINNNRLNRPNDIEFYVIRNRRGDFRRILFLLWRNSWFFIFTLVKRLALQYDSNSLVIKRLRLLNIFGEVRYISTIIGNSRDIGVTGGHLVSWCVTGGRSKNLGNDLLTPSFDSSRRLDRVMDQSTAVEEQIATNYADHQLTNDV